MKRRAFFTVLGIGTAATVATGAASAKGSRSGKRDIQWARARTQDGHRVRLESWRVPMHERPALESQPDSGVQIRMGSPAGLSSIDECAVTVEMLEGPWEIVPESDYPEPPKPTSWTTGGNVVLLGGNCGGNITIRGGAGGF